MNLIIILEILILFQKVLNQYAPNQIYHLSQQYTQAAYYLPSQNEEYSWTEGNHIKTRKTRRKRKKHNDYYISAELDYDPRRLQCKCKCKRKYDTKPVPEYDQNYPCCPCDSKPDAGNEYLPPQYPDAETNGISIPTQFPYPVDSGIYTPATYPPMIYHTFDLSEIGKVFPWLTTKADSNGQTDKDKTSTKYDKDKSSKSDDKDKPTTGDDRDIKDKSSTSDDKEKATTRDDRDKNDKSSKSDDKDKATTRDDRDKNDKSSKSDDKDKATTRDDRVRTSEEVTTTIDDRDKPGKDEKDKTSTKEKPPEKSSRRTEESTTSTTTEPTISTYPYMVSENSKQLLHYLTKKKQCLRDNNWVRKDTNRKIGRYYEGDLVERPTIASYLNGNGRRNNFPRKLNEDRYNALLRHYTNS